MFIEPNDGSHVFEIQLGASPPANDEGNARDADVGSVLSRLAVHRSDWSTPRARRALVQSPGPRIERTLHDAVRGVHVAQLRRAGGLDEPDPCGALFEGRRAADSRRTAHAEPIGRSRRRRAGRLPLRCPESGYLSLRIRLKLMALYQLPLVDPTDTPAEQGDVVHFGIQEGTTEGLLYSGVFVEDASRGISIGHGTVVRPF